MYEKVCSKKKWKMEIINISKSEAGGFKEIIFSVSGNDIYSYLKYESGVHRVQRVPDTETQGRVHTSAATVAVLPEVGDVDIEIKETDLRIDVFRSGGPGGQSVNTTDSAVRITHLKYNIVVQSQSERSQHRNRDTAMKMLKSRIYEIELDKKNEEKKKKESNKKQIGWGNQIRSYVLHPYKMVKDLRTNYQTSNAENVLDGEIYEFLESTLIDA
jgi:protein subunit release factor A